MHYINLFFILLIGDWGAGERYLHNIIEDLNHWVVGWTDWNLVLDLQVSKYISNRVSPYFSNRLLHQTGGRHNQKNKFWSKKDWPLR